MQLDLASRPTAAADVRRTQLSAVDRAAASAAFRAWFGTPPVLSELLVNLLQVGREPQSVQTLARQLDTSSEAVHRHVCELRKALGGGAIDCRRLAGYSLTDVGMAECQTAIREMVDCLRRIAA